MFSLDCRGKLLFIEKPLVMGILNITEDSFYPGSRLQSPEEIKNKASQMLQEGADILDLGAQSTRPGSRRMTVAEESEKLWPAIALLKEHFPEAILSVDTYHAEVAESCVLRGASMINDISGGEMDKRMIPAVAGLHVPYICMHMKGTPENMQHQTQYEDVVKEILDFFIDKTEECRRAGMKDVIIDPGFGFGKNSRQNFLLLKNLSAFRMLDRPILAGVSRKSTIYKTLQVPVEDSLNGTTVLHTLALLNGASLLRVHDVREAKQAITLVAAYGAA
jgi:dihydropteroate synthase